MKGFHVTTFGCQMNEHDSERMKGMLESLGYARGARARGRGPDPVQHLLDPREGRRPLRRPPARGRGAQAPRPGAGDRGRRLLGAVGQGQRVPPVPVRRRRVRPRPGPQARRVPDQSDSITAQGFFEFEGFTGHLPAKRARDFQGWVQISAGCNMVCSYCIVPSTRGPRGVAAARRARRRGARAGRRRRARGHAAGPERQLLRAQRCGRGRRSPSCCTRSTRSPGSTASATRARTRPT